MAPLSVAALLDAAAADDAVVAALAAKDNPALRQREAGAAARGRSEGFAEGKAEGKAESILMVLEARGISVGLAQRQEISSCQDGDRLSRWLRRAAIASSAGEVLSEP